MVMVCLHRLPHGVPRAAPGHRRPARTTVGHAAPAARTCLASPPRAPAPHRCPCHPAGRRPRGRPSPLPPSPPPHRTHHHHPRTPPHTHTHPHPPTREPVPTQHP